MDYFTVLDFSTRSGVPDDPGPWGPQPLSGDSRTLHRNATDWLPHISDVSIVRCRTSLTVMPSVSIGPFVRSGPRIPPQNSCNSTSRLIGRFCLNHGLIPDGTTVPARNIPEPEMFPTNAPETADWHAFGSDIRVPYPKFCTRIPPVLGELHPTVERVRVSGADTA